MAIVIVWPAASVTLNRSTSLVPRDPSPIRPEIRMSPDVIPSTVDVGLAQRLGARQEYLAAALADQSCFACYSVSRSRSSVVQCRPPSIE